MPDNDTLREMHRQMVRIRIFEETLVQVYMEGKTPAFDIAMGPVPGEMHLCAGQEPSRPGVRPPETHRRDHRDPPATHEALAHGVDMKMMAAEIFGKETGLGHGKGGHMHCSRRSRRSAAAALSPRESRPRSATRWHSRRWGAMTSRCRSSGRAPRTRVHSTSR